MCKDDTLAVSYINSDGIMEYRYMTKLFVGMVLNDCIGHCDSTQFDIDDFGAFLHIFVNEPTANELREFSSVKKEVRLAHINDVMWFTFKFGKLNWMDAPYTPYLSKNLHFLNSMVRFAELCRKITVILIDTSDGVVKYVEEIPLSDDFADGIFRLVYQIRANSVKFDSDKYYEFLAEIESHFSAAMIAEQSGNIKCVIGHKHQRNC